MLSSSLSLLRLNTLRPCFARRSLVASVGFARQTQHLHVRTRAALLRGRASAPTPSAPTRAPATRAAPMSTSSSQPAADEQQQQKTAAERAADARNFRRWNRLADSMSHFHEYFKAEFNAIYEMADGSFTKRGMNLRMYLSMAGELKKHLTVHHTIEERHIFPVLAKRMPEFRDDEEHIKSHHAIHDGLDKLGALIEKWLAEPSTYSPQEMRDSLDSWREVLFRHLDHEVKDLSAENMKKYWKLEEIDRIVM